MFIYSRPNSKQRTKNPKSRNMPIFSFVKVFDKYDELITGYTLNRAENNYLDITSGKTLTIDKVKSLTKVLKRAKYLKVQTIV